MASSDSSTSPTVRPRAIVLCFDGTSGEYDSTNTNVVKLCALLRKDCPEEQVVYYQPGIGTYFATGVVSPLWTSWAALLDKAVAWYLEEHVMAGYKFLMDNYRAGDKICLFGFSRGAYTARALAGMLDKVGLLPKGNLQQIHFAYKAYTRTDKEGIRLAAGFKETFSQDVRVDFLGVWDTVQSTGVLISRSLPFTDSNTAIRVFRHALALDERRARFRPKLYHWPVEDDQKSATIQKSNSILSKVKQLFRRKHEKSPSYQSVQSCKSMTGTSTSLVSNDAAASENGEAQSDFVPEENFPTDVLEVWFSGCHSDVGGGNVGNDVDISLAQIPLRWMVEHIIQSGCGIRFNTDKLACLSLQPQALPEQKQSGPDAHCTFKGDGNASGSGHAIGVSPDTSELVGRDTVAFPERSDAHAPLYDELRMNLCWWVLEFLPVLNVWQDGNRQWHDEWRINRGKGRFIPFQGPKFHHTVKERMNCEPLKYRPQAIYDNDEVYV